MGIQGYLLHIKRNITQQFNITHTEQANSCKFDCFIGVAKHLIFKGFYSAQLLGLVFGPVVNLF